MRGFIWTHCNYLDPENRGRMSLWNISIYLQYYTVHQPRRLQSEHSPLWKPENLYILISPTCLIDMTNSMRMLYNTSLLFLLQYMINKEYLPSSCSFTSKYTLMVPSNSNYIWSWTLLLSLFCQWHNECIKHDIMWYITVLSYGLWIQYREFNLFSHLLYIHPHWAANHILYLM
jgi:hypothetical protein